MVLRQREERLSSRRDNKFFFKRIIRNEYIKKSPFYKGYRGFGKLSNVLDFKRYATHITMICTGHFSVEILGNVLFC